MAGASKTNSPISTSQIALIAVLGLIFIAVLVMQFGGGESDVTEVESAPAPPVAGSPAGTPAAVAASAAKQATPRTAWPRISLEEAAGYDPFSLHGNAGSQISAALRGSTDQSTEAEQAAKTARSTTLHALQSQGVNVVFQDQQGAVAMVGTRLVRVGDLLDGYRVMKIGPDGVTLSPPSP